MSGLQVRNQPNRDRRAERRRAVRTRSGLVLAMLFLGTFAVGCGEMLVVGVLDLLARDLDVSVPAAGS
jgi:DHA1 family inner membrane transport protein